MGRFNIGARSFCSRLSQNGRYFCGSDSADATAGRAAKNDPVILGDKDSSRAKRAMTLAILAPADIPATRNPKDGVASSVW